MKGYFSKLPDTVCSSEKFSAGNGSSCWNGTSTNRYLKPVPVLSLTTQVAENPEVQVPDALVPNVVKLIEKLNQMTKGLHSRVIPRLPLMQADASMENSGHFMGYYDMSSGSGWIVGFSEDDEDGDESGSASGHGSQTTSSVSDVHREGAGSGPETSKDTTDFGFESRTMHSTHVPPYKTNQPLDGEGGGKTNGGGTALSSAAGLVSFLLLGLAIQRIRRV